MLSGLSSSWHMNPVKSTAFTLWCLRKWLPWLRSSIWACARRHTSFCSASVDAGRDTWWCHWAAAVWWRHKPPSTPNAGPTGLHNLAWDWAAALQCTKITVWRCFTHIRLDDKKQVKVKRGIRPVFIFIVRSRGDWGEVGHDSRVTSENLPKIGYFNFA